MLEPQPETLNLKAARAWAARQPLSAAERTARTMYGGDLLGGATVDGFEHWSGPVFRISSGLGAAETIAASQFKSEFEAAIKRSFASSNFVREMADRHINGAASREPTWVVSAGEQEGEPQNPLALEADTLLKLWWEKSRARAVWKEALRKACLEGGLSYLRLWVAPAAMVSDADGATTLKPLEPAQAGRFLKLETLSRDTATRWEQPSTLEPANVVQYSFKDSSDREVQAAEVVWVDELLQTHFRLLEGETVREATLDLGGRVSLIPARAFCWVDDVFIRAQNAFSTSSTMIQRNTELAGFIERYGINIQPPFDVDIDPITKAQTKRYKKLNVGPGTMTVFASATTTDKDGVHTAFPSPSYGRFEPVDPIALTKSADHFERILYRSSVQMYVLMSGDGAASGYSRVTAMDDHRAAVMDTASEAATTLRELLETVLAFVGALSGQPGRYSGLTVDARVRVQVATPSVLERKADREDVASGIISSETARYRQGIDDSAAEDAQIERERALSPPDTQTNLITPPPK